jgi:hypothetical protein
MSSYEKILNIMNEFVHLSQDEKNKMEVITWYGEFNRFHWELCDLIISELYKCPYDFKDPRFFISSDSETIIRTCGKSINLRGTFDLMLIDFYIMRCFMCIDGRAICVEKIWDGIGEWKC